MPTVISAQSHVCYGHVGNSAAVFPMQKLGVEVVSVPTTILSNHPAHSTFFGEAVSAGLLKKLFRGLEDRGVFHNSDAFQSGYLATEDNAEMIAGAVQRYKGLRPEGIYCLDPVMGDVEKGLFVPPAIPVVISNQLLPLADIITPNKFEFELLTSSKFTRHLDMVSAANELMRRHQLRSVVITSADFEASADCVGSDNTHILVIKAGEAWLVSTPRLKNAPSGTGDMFSGLFMARLLLGEDEKLATKRSVDSLFGIIKGSTEQNQQELGVITHQHCILNAVDVSTVKIV